RHRRTVDGLTRIRFASSSGVSSCSMIILLSFCVGSLFAPRTVVGVLGLPEWAALALDRPPSDQMDDLVIRGGRGVVASSPASSSVMPFLSLARCEPVPRHRPHHC